MRTVGPVATFILVFLCVPTARAQIIIQNGGLWEFDVHANLRACLGGSCASSSASDSTQVDVPSGAIVNVGILVGSCAAAVDPQQVAALSEYVPAKHGRRKLQITDRKALRGLLADCTGYAGFRLMRMTGRLELAPDGNSFDTTIRVAFTLRAQGHTLNASLVTKVHGALLGEGDVQLQGEGTGFLNPVAAVVERLDVPADDVPRPVRRSSTPTR